MTKDKLVKTGKSKSADAIDNSRKENSIRRRRRCFVCSGCTSLNCGKCLPCLKPEVSKSVCVMRKCVNLQRNIAPKKLQSLKSPHIGKIKLEVRQKNFQCEFCPYVPSSMLDLTQHHKEFHPESLQCSICDFTSNRRSLLIRHVNMVHNGLKPYKCHYCPSEFALKGNMVVHIRRRHEQDDRFQCHVCSYSNPIRSTVKKHIRYQHDKIIDHQCEICGFTAITKEKLKKHVKAVHDKIKDELCDVCPARFANRYNLKSHIKTVHLGIKEFKCNECSFETSRARYLNKHVVSHQVKKEILIDATSIRSNPPSPCNKNLSVLKKQECRIMLKRNKKLDLIAALRRI